MGRGQNKLCSHQEPGRAGRGGPAVGKVIPQGRRSEGLTQKDLATQIRESRRSSRTASVDGPFPGTGFWQVESHGPQGPRGSGQGQGALSLEAGAFGGARAGCRGLAAVAWLPWPGCRGLAAVALLPWPGGRGPAAVAWRLWPCCRGPAAVARRPRGALPVARRDALLLGCFQTRPRRVCLPLIDFPPYPSSSSWGAGPASSPAGWARSWARLLGGGVGAPRGGRARRGGAAACPALRP